MNSVSVADALVTVPIITNAGYHGDNFNGYHGCTIFVIMVFKVLVTLVLSNGLPR